jgi:RNA polymerase sigma factor (sigma-70 family)
MQRRRLPRSLDKRRQTRSIRQRSVGGISCTRRMSDSCRSVARKRSCRSLSMLMTVTNDAADFSGLAFTRFVEAVEPRLLQALVARFGAVDGREATVDALSWAWEHWARAARLHHPVGYLFRVGVTSARRFRSQSTTSNHADRAQDAHYESDELIHALDSLSSRQRTVVVLVNAYQWRIREVADHLDISPSTAQRHLARGLARLHLLMKESP